MATYVAVFALVLAYLALIAAYFSFRTLARLRRATVVLALGADGESLVETAARNAELTEELTAQVEQLRAELDRSHVDGALRNIALVRYDADDEVTGRASFSLAIVDERGDGIAISARAEAAGTRVYAKGVRAGSGQDELSPEERQAVTAAVTGGRPRLLSQAS